MDEDGDANDASAIWSTPQAGERRPTRPPKDPLLQVTKLTVSSLEEFETSLRGYLDNPPADIEHSQCEIEIWGGVTLLVRAFPCFPSLSECFRFRAAQPDLRLA